MHHFFRALILFAMQCSVWLSVGGIPAHAEDMEQSQPPQHIQTGIYIINLEQLDARTGNYTVEFFLTFRCNGAVACDVTDFRIVDGKFSILDKDEFKQAGWTQITYHVRADLNENLNFGQFPFDSHTLGIRMESTDLPRSAMILSPQDALSGLDPDLELAGWSILPAYQITEASHSHKVLPEPVSRITFTLSIQRPYLYGWLKAILPATIILVSGLLAYLFHHDAAGNSISVVTAALVGSVLFNINLTSSLPATGQFTVADLYMIINYVALVTTLAVMIVVYVTKERSRDELARRLLSVARRIVPPAWLVAQLLLLAYVFIF